jgi:protein-tyrosine phosphatase
MTTGRIDVHSHLLPAIDDGCETVNQSLICARELVKAGYTHAFCTPHVLPSDPHITAGSIPRWTSKLQEAMDRAKIPLKLLPGGEMGLHSRFVQTPDQQVVSYALAGKYALIDMWDDVLPTYFEPSVRFLQSKGLKVILAHPERMDAVQDQPDLVDHFAELGVLLQGNLQCFSDAPEMPTRRLVERYLQEGRYFLLGSDTHRPDTIARRINGLTRATDLVGQDVVARLTMENPKALLPAAGQTA